MDIEYISTFRTIRCNSKFYDTVSRCSQSIRVLADRLVIHETVMIRRLLIRRFRRFFGNKGWCLANWKFYRVAYDSHVLIRSRLGFNSGLIGSDDIFIYFFDRLLLWAYSDSYIHWYMKRFFFLFLRCTSMREKSCWYNYESQYQLFRVLWVKIEILFWIKCRCVQRASGFFITISLDHVSILKWEIKWTLVVRDVEKSCERKKECLNFIFIHDIPHRINLPNPSGPNSIFLYLPAQICTNKVHFICSNVCKIILITVCRRPSQRTFAWVVSQNISMRRGIWQMTAEKTPCWARRGLRWNGKLTPVGLVHLIIIISYCPYINGCHFL